MSEVDYLFLFFWEEKELGVGDGVDMEFQTSILRFFFFSSLILSHLGINH